MRWAFEPVAFALAVRFEPEAAPDTPANATASNSTPAQTPSNARRRLDLPICSPLLEGARFAPVWRFLTPLREKKKTCETKDAGSAPK